MYGVPNCPASHSPSGSVLQTLPDLERREATPKKENERTRREKRKRMSAGRPAALLRPMRPTLGWSHPPRQHQPAGPKRVRAQRCASPRACHSVRPHRHRLSLTSGAYAARWPRPPPRGGLAQHGKNRLERSCAENWRYAKAAPSRSRTSATLPLRHTPPRFVPQGTSRKGAWGSGPGLNAQKRNNRGPLFWKCGCLGRNMRSYPNGVSPMPTHGV